MRYALVVALLAFASSGLCHSVFAASYSFTTIDVPFAGATSIRAMGINKAGDIVGSYTGGDGSAHGFLFKDGEFTPIDFPGALGTSASGINGRGEIVGTYGSLDGFNHGFVKFKEKFTTIDFPGAIHTSASGINRRGQIVGFYFDDSFAQHSFLLSARKFTTVDVPNAQIPKANGIDDQGRIVGSCFLPVGSPAGNVGFLDNDNMFTFFQLTTAGEFFFTSANGINSGVIVGVFLPNFTNFGAGFVMPPPYDSPTAVQFPNAESTEANGINSEGQIVGDYQLPPSQGSTIHGFLALPQ